MEPRHYQERALEALAEHDNTGLLALGLGVGKTAVGTWAAMQAGAKTVLVVAPLRTVDGWRRHVEDLAGVPLRVLGSNKAGKENMSAMLSGEPGWYWTTWEYMVSQNKEKRWDGRKKREVFKPVVHPYKGTVFDMLIADEVHRASNHGTLSFGVLSRIKAEHRLALSATPAGNRPVNIWSSLKFLWPTRYRGYWDFAATYFREEYDPFTDFGKKYTDEQRPGTVRRAAPCWIEVTAEEANPEMPEVVVEHVPVQLSREQRRMYDQWEQESLAWLDANPVAIGLPVTLELRLRQVTLGAVSVEVEHTKDEDGNPIDVDHIYFKEDCKSSKIDTLLDMLSDMPEGEPVIVWCPSQRFMLPLLHRLDKAGYTAIEVSGKSKGDYHDLIAGDAQVLCAVPEAMAEGVDGLQSVCHTEVWLGMSTNLIINEQATGRLHRTGQTQAVKRYLIQADDTIDSKVVGRLNDNYNRLKASGLI